jgi:hypothetical protein
LQRVSGFYGETIHRRDDTPTRYTGTISLLVDIHAAYVQAAQASGEEPCADLHERIRKCAEDFNANSKSIEIKPCGKKFGIFSKV